MDSDFEEFRGSEQLGKVAAGKYYMMCSTVHPFEKEHNNRRMKKERKIRNAWKKSLLKWGLESNQPFFDWLFMKTHRGGLVFFLYQWLQ